ncbi:hypothetical protein P8452_26428 [Trifolium repens]|nr:hypothetical protein P8452_26428 [Trifolium repens]
MMFSATSLPASFHRYFDISASYPNELQHLSSSSCVELKVETLSCKIHVVVVVVGNSGHKMQASDRFNINSQLEHLQAKYVGTGHADMNRFEWAVNIQRDSYASYIGHYTLLSYFAIAENESIGRQRYTFMQKMLLPCGLPPEREED